jgi:hypothetical protein
MPHRIEQLLTLVQHSEAQQQKQGQKTKDKVMIVYSTERVVQECH